MAFRYYKRIKLGKGFGLNVSKSGIRPSYRSKRGSISSRGFTLRTGIPGLNYRKNFSKSSGCVLALVIMISLILSFSFLACTSNDEEPDCGTYNGHELFIGPQGGCYYINSNDNQVYVDRSNCNC
ncbi:DUF4236 domain-containing protein [Pseudotenacibaculum haliotis]|uniref:DUF4236 domain-containing protein n=1 Tax=Pseudotenacibaculum haliotis TaxID=1862138 RepID=A0ABW5LX70_9FLAO